GNAATVGNESPSSQRIELSSDELTPAEPSIAEGAAARAPAPAHAPAPAPANEQGDYSYGSGSSSASISHSSSASYTGAGASVPMRYGGCLGLLLVLL